MIRRRIGDPALAGTALGVYGTTVITAVLGAGFWIIAARLADPVAIGRAGAVLAVMMLAARAGTLGLSTLLIGRLAAAPDGERPLVSAAMRTAALVAGVLGLAAGMVLLISGEDGAATGPLLLLVVVGAAGTAAGFVLDGALIGAARSRMQLARNTAASLVKLGCLPVLALLAIGDTIAIVSATVVGTLLSLAAAVVLRAPHGTGLPIGSLVSLATTRDGLRHHAFNLTLLLPGLALPILAGLLPAAEQGEIYIALTVAALVWAVPESLAVALYARGSEQPESLHSRMRTAAGVSLGAGALASLALLVLAEPLLGLFGPGYAEGAAGPLRVLALAFLPATIVSLYAPVVRLRGTFTRGSALALSGALVGMAGAALGAVLAGGIGFATGWLVGSLLGRLPLLPSVVRVARPGRQGADGDRLDAPRSRSAA